MVVTLLNLTPDVIRRCAHPEDFELIHGAAFGEMADAILGVAQANDSFRSRTGSRPEWGGYLAIDPAKKRVVGTCAFKGEPTDGLVEIAYYTLPPYEGQGYASAMARELLRLANASAAVRRIVAHTLPEENASTSVLVKLGFQKVGDITDPEDGPLWRWLLEK